MRRTFVSAQPNSSEEVQSKQILELKLLQYECVPMIE